MLSTHAVTSFLTIFNHTIYLSRVGFLVPFKQRVMGGASSSTSLQTRCCTKEIAMPSMAPRLVSSRKLVAKHICCFRLDSIISAENWQSATCDCSCARFRKDVAAMFSKAEMTSISALPGVCMCKVPHSEKCERLSFLILLIIF